VVGQSALEQQWASDTCSISFIYVYYCLNIRSRSLDSYLSQSAMGHRESILKKRLNPTFSLDHARCWMFGSSFLLSIECILMHTIFRSYNLYDSSDLSLAIKARISCFLVHEMFVHAAHLNLDRFACLIPRFTRIHSYFTAQLTQPNLIRQLSRNS
jgi:hypothetical protein